jgi:hypothetical protein
VDHIAPPCGHRRPFQHHKSASESRDIQLVLAKSAGRDIALSAVQPGIGELACIRRRRASSAHGDNTVDRAAMSWGRRQETFFWLLIVVEFLLAIGGMWVAGQR